MNFKDWFITWFKAARAPFLVVSLLPCLLAGVMARTHGPVNLWHFILATVGVVMAHSAADFIDDYFDFQKGNLGNKVQQFHDSPLIDGKVTLRQVAIAIILCLAIAAAAGTILLVEVGLPVLIMIIIGLFIVFFYTSPPIRLNYRGFGETMLFLAFGPLTIVGVYYVLTGSFSWEAFIVSLIPGVFTMNVGLVSNTFDHDDDIPSGKMTLPVRLGQANAVRLMAAGTGVAYLSILAGVMGRLLPVWTLLVFLSLPLAVSVLQNARQYKDLTRYTPAMGRAIAISAVSVVLLTMAYGIVFL